MASLLCEDFCKLFILLIFNNIFPDFETTAVHILDVIIA